MHAPTKSRVVVDEHRLRRSVCRESFYAFVQQFWDVIVPEPPVWNWHIEYLCHELQAMAERIFRRQPKEYDLICNIPPGSTKSTIFSVMLPAWTWTRMPSFRSICGSYAYPLAMDLSRKSRDIVLSEKYQRAFPEIRLRDDQNAKGYFANTRGGIRYAVGIGGSVTGMHGHALIVDDPLDPNAAMSDADLKSANTWMSETLPSRKVDKEVSVTMLVMQRLHQNDPTGYRLAKKGAGPVKHICLPAEDGPHVSPAEMRNRYVGGLLDPVRLSRKVLGEARVELGEYGYACQYDENPIPRGGGMFKVERIRIDTPPARFAQIVRYWDNAATDGGNGAHTAGVKMGFAPQHVPQYWILNVKRGRWDSHSREATKLQTAKLDGPGVLIGVEQEPGSGGKDQAEATVRNLAGFRVRVDRPSGDKALRADPFSTQVNAGNVGVVNAEWTADYLEELRYFPNSRFKDQTDASSGAFGMLAGKRVKLGVL